VGEAKRATYGEARAWCRMVATIYADAADLGYSPSVAIERIVSEHNRRQEMARRATDSDDRQQRGPDNATR